MSKSLSARSEKLTLSIGGIVGHLEIAGAAPVFLEQVRARYGAFVLPSADWVGRDFSLQIKLDSVAAPGSRAEAPGRDRGASAEGHRPRP